MYEDMQSLANILQSDIGQDMRVHNSAFLWFIPYVQSVMDLKDLGIACIMEVIHHLYSEIKDVLNQRSGPCDKVTELFIKVLVSIIELHRSKKCLHLLWVSSHKWVEALVKGSMIPSKDMVSQHYSKITSASPLLCSQAPLSVQFACIQLIRSLLREGYQLGQHSTCKQYLDKLNLVIRGNVLWNLEFSKSEIRGLQSCLTQVIKSIKDQTATIPNFVVEQSNVGKAQSVPFIKTERMDEDDEWYGRNIRSPLQSPDIAPAVTGKSYGCSTGSPLSSPDIQLAVASSSSEQGSERLFFPIKKEPQDVQTKETQLSSSLGCGLKISVKESFDETVQEDTQCKEKLSKPPLPKEVLPERKPPVSSTTNSVLQPINQNNAMLPPTLDSSTFLVAGCLPQLDQAWLMQEVLHWKYEMFDNFQQFGPPSNLCPLPLMKVPLKFSCYDEYFKVYFPLMLQNAFESVSSCGCFFVPPPPFLGEGGSVNLIMYFIQMGI